MLRNIASEEGYTTAANFTDRARDAGLATQTDVTTAINAEAVNRTTAISNATNGFVRNDDLDTKIDSRTSALGLIKGSDVDSKISVATSSLATKTELATEKTAREAAIANEATNRATAINAEATARASAITNATSGFITLNDITSDKITQLGFAKTADVDTAIANTEVRLNKATNQKLGTAFGLTINDDSDVNMTQIQTQLQEFAGSTLLTANIISDETEGNQTLTQWLNNKQSVENANFTDIANRLTQLAEDIVDIKNTLNEHAQATASDAHGSDSLFDSVTGYDGPIYHPIGGITPSIGGKKD